MKKKCSKVYNLCPILQGAGLVSAELHWQCPACKALAGGNMNDEEQIKMTHCKCVRGIFIFS